MCSAVAETHADWRYLHAVIRWNTEKVLGASDSELEKYVIHEYVHCLTDELVSYATNHHQAADMGQVERVVSELTLAIQFAFRKS